MQSPLSHAGQVVQQHSETLNLVNAPGRQPRRRQHLRVSRWGVQPDGVMNRPHAINCFNMPAGHLLLRSVNASSNFQRCLTIYRIPVLARTSLMSREVQDVAVSPMEEKTGIARISSTNSPPNVGSMTSLASGKTGKAGHESWVRAYLPPDLPAGSTSFQCVFCKTNLSLKNISRVKQHLLNQKVCRFIFSDQAGMSTEPEIVRARAALGTPVPADQLEAAASRGELPPVQPAAFPDTLAAEPNAASSDRQAPARKRAKTSQASRCLI